MWRNRYGRLSGGAVVLEAVGTLLGQGLFGRLSTRHASHILLASWLFFGVVVGTAYRSSLIASLTIPKYPKRPETLEELVTYVENREK
ncbi:hypothetical protein E2C01_035916 [Portunus trituberculatus]|uniref:Ionotropic glutamate receptor C-terminal domain-containing protein n=1 Tax=Portunus trituberculatus TaxID=210409 RepID=A0A5B7F9R8_PORTR|nr:hypothetical protein [Portunus trituberculatus]